MKRNTDDDPTCDPLPPPFPVGARVRYIGKRTLHAADVPQGEMPRTHEVSNWLTLLAPGMEVTITEIKTGRRGTGVVLDEEDDIIDSTDDGYSVYHVQGKHRRSGRLIWPCDAPEWEQLGEPEGAR